MGADPSLPGPGTYINPMTEGRNARGEVKGVLSNQKNVPSLSFALGGMKEHGRPVELYSVDRMGEINCVLDDQLKARNTSWTTSPTAPKCSRGLDRHRRV